MITDVASVKGSLWLAAESAWGAMPPFLVLGHPIAGSERSGVDASDQDLFAAHRVILTPVEGNDGAAVDQVLAPIPDRNGGNISAILRHEEAEVTEGIVCDQAQDLVSV